MYLSFIFVVLISCVHIFANKISVNKLSGNKWLSLAGGVSVAFFFLHLLPELHEMQESLDDSILFSFLDDREMHLMAISGILLFYGLEQGVIFYKKKTVDVEINKDKIIFWSHIGIFASFNFVIGYYLHHEMEVEGISSFLTFTALGFHFVITDYSLLRHHNHKYLNIGRWIMTGAVIAGWGIGVLFTIPDKTSYVLFALVSGAIVVNSFKEELPEEKESHFGFFLAGAILYTLLLIL